MVLTECKARRRRTYTGGATSVVIFDLMNTVLVTVEDRKKTVAKIYRAKLQTYLDSLHLEHTHNLKEVLSDDFVWETILNQRKRTEQYKSEGQSYWIVTNQKVYEALHEHVHQRHVKPVVMRQVDQLMPGRYRSFKEVVSRNALSSHRIPTHMLWKMASETHDEFLENVDHYRANDGLIKVIRRLHERGVHVVIGSNQREVPAMNLMRARRVKRYFDAIYTSESLGVEKPDPEFGRRILAKIGEHGSVVYVGNSANNDWWGIQIGVTPIIYDTSGLVSEQLSASTLPSHIVELKRHLTAGRVHLTRSNEELEELLGALVN